MDFMSVCHGDDWRAADAGEDHARPRPTFTGQRCNLFNCEVERRVGSCWRKGRCFQANEVEKWSRLFAGWWLDRAKVLSILRDTHEHIAQKDDSSRCGRGIGSRSSLRRG